MNAVEPRPRAGSSSDPPLHDTHFVVLDFEGTTAKGAPLEPIEVAALGLKCERGRWPLPTGFKRLHAQPAETQRSDSECG